MQDGGGPSEYFNCWIVIDALPVHHLFTAMGNMFLFVQYTSEPFLSVGTAFFEKMKYSGMPKSERPKTEQCQNPNKMVSHFQT